jgi:hypothetical protein
MRRAALLLALALSACGPAVAPAAKVVAPPPADEPAEPAPASRAPEVGPNGEKAAIDGVRVKITPASGPEILVDPAELHPPSGDRSLRGISPTALLYLDDGTLLVGAADGSVSALDARGRRRASLGLRGQVRALAPAGEGLAVAVTDHGVLALVGADGAIRWERALTAEPLSRPVVVPGRMILTASQRAVFAVSLAGEPLFSHASPKLFRDTCDQWGNNCKEWIPDLRLDGQTVIAGDALTFSLDAPHPAAPSLEPVFPLAFRKVLDGKTIALLPGDGGEIWALVRVAAKKDASDDGLFYPFDPTRGDEFAEDRFDLVRLQGEAVTRFKVPHQGAKKEVFVAGATADEGPYLLDGLSRGPDGGVLVLGRRISWTLTGGESGYVGMLRGAGLLLELSGGKVRPRDDLQAMLSARVLTAPLAAAPDGKARVFCADDLCFELSPGGHRDHAAPGPVVALARVGASEWAVEVSGTVDRAEGQGWAKVAREQDRSIRAIAGTGERDVWGDPRHRYLASHFDGSAWRDVPVPVESLDGLVARAPDDVWAKNGRAHWDGQRWSRVHGAPRGLALLASAPGDVWIGSQEGLFHGTAPGPAPVRLGAPADAPAPVPASVEAPLGAPLAGHAVERVSFALDKGGSLSAGLGISAAADGTLWILAADRLVEVAGGHAETLRKLRPGLVSRWAHAEGKGKGHLLDGDLLLRLDGDRAVPAEAQLDRHRVAALHGHPQGALWVVGAPLEESSAYPLEQGPHALVRAGAAAQPVLGLPAAAYTDVAATPDGGAFFAGARSPGPAGEGILVHARGPLGAKGTVRHRVSAALLAVSAAGPDEAWAVGAAGVILHVRGAEVTRFVLPSREWLRQVLVVAPDEVWIGGDGGTLLRWDGRALLPVPHPLGVNATFTGLAAARGAVWAVGPAGIVRIRRG